MPLTGPTIHKVCRFQDSSVIEEFSSLYYMWCHLLPLHHMGMKTIEFCVSDGLPIHKLCRFQDSSVIEEFSSLSPRGVVYLPLHHMGMKMLSVVTM